MAWTFKNFVSERGDDVIRQWIKTLPKKVRFKIDTRVKYLQTVEKLKYPYVEKWSGVADLYEVRITSSGVQYRILGCYGAEHDFILLIGAVEKDWKLEPRNAEMIAQARMKRVKNEKDNVTYYFQPRKA